MISNRESKCVACKLFESQVTTAYNMQTVPAASGRRETTRLEAVVRVGQV